MARDIIAADFKATPYWWDAVPRPDWPQVPLPAEVDVVVVGSGFTGLSAALTLARGGRGVHIIEAEAPGHGASTRNAGFLGTVLWVKFPAMAAKYGVARATAIMAEVVRANRYVGDLVRDEQIGCDLVRCGRFLAAHSTKAYDKLSKHAEQIRRHLGLEAEMVPRSRQRAEIGSDLYHGGMVVPFDSALHPARYHAGLLDRVTTAGAALTAHTTVTAITRQGARLAVRTPRGIVKAGDVVLATNGYTDTRFPWFRNRMIPVHSGIMVTEPIGCEAVAQALPTGRIVIDTKINPYSCRPSPDGTRLQFSSARGLLVKDHKAKARQVHATMVEVFPDLADAKVAHYWTGQMGFTLDKLPHIGVRDGIHYALGYCGAGVPLSAWLGHRVAARVLGRADAPTAFDDGSFPAIPFYRGRPWFLPAIIRYYAMRDRLDRRVA